MAEKLDINSAITMPTCTWPSSQVHLQREVLGVDRQQRNDHAEAEQVDKHGQEDDQQRAFARCVGHEVAGWQSGFGRPRRGAMQDQC